MDFALKTWVDADNDGETRDEFIVKMSDADISTTALITDKVPQGPKDLWTFRHPTDSSDGSSNVLIGDGHVETRKAGDIIVRWGVDYPVGW